VGVVSGDNFGFLAGERPSSLSTTARRNEEFELIQGYFELDFCLGTGHYLWRGEAPKRNVFLRKNFAAPTIK
jgi:hypothetical protein